MLNVGPYITVKLNKKEKKMLANSEVLDPEGDNDLDIKCDWYLTNDPNLDDVWDSRDTDFWDKGEEYPFPYSLLIGGNTANNHYESLTEKVIENFGLLHYFK